MNISSHRRIVDVFGDITQELALRVADDLISLDSESSDPINLRISSDGGDINAALLIIDIMDAIACDVYTVGLGTCSSAASLILGAGKKGHRSVNRNIFVLLHEVSGTISGDAYDIETGKRNFELQRKTVIGLYSRYTGHAENEIEKDIKDGRILHSGEEVVEYGLADIVL